MRPLKNQSPILAVIKASGQFGLHASEIRRKTGVERGAMSVALVRLQRQGLVIAHGADTRKRYYASEWLKAAGAPLAEAEEFHWQLQRLGRSAMADVRRETRKLFGIKKKPAMEIAVVTDLAEWHRQTHYAGSPAKRGN